MDRRTKHRVDLQLICSLGGSAVRSTPLQSVTENISRDGILMRWLRTVPLPEVGSGLTVEFALPASGEFGQRAMRCRTTVVRITKGMDGQSAVALHIEGINFVAAGESASPEPDLELMKPATEHIN